MTDWRSFADVAKLLNEKELDWTKCPQLKYIEIRVDTRTMDCVVLDRENNLVPFDVFVKNIQKMQLESSLSMKHFYGGPTPLELGEPK